MSIDNQKIVIANYRKAIEADNKNPNNHYNLTVALYKINDFSGAQTYFFKAIELDPFFLWHMQI